MKNKTLKIVLAFITVLTLFLGFNLTNKNHEVKAEGTSYTCNGITFDTAFEGTVSSGKNYYLTEDINLTSNLSLNTAKFYLNGHNIKLNSYTINAYGSDCFYIYDNSSNVQYFTDSNSDGVFETLESSYDTTGKTLGTDYVKVTGGAIYGGTASYGTSSVPGYNLYGVNFVGNKNSSKILFAYPSEKSRTNKIEYCTFVGNGAGNYATLELSYGDVIIDHCSFEYNVKPSATSSLIEVGNSTYGEYFSHSLTITNSTFAYNKGPSSIIRIKEFVDVNIKDTEFNYNEGGYYCCLQYASSASSTKKYSVSLDNVDFSYNKGTHAIFGITGETSWDNRLIVSIKNSNVNNNESQGNGTFLYNNTNSELTIKDCDFEENLNINRDNTPVLTGKGSVLYADADSKKQEINVINSKFVENGASEGGVFYLNAGQTLLVFDKNTLIKDNQAKNGGAIYCGIDDPHPVNTIVFDNAVIEGNRAAERGGAIFANTSILLDEVTLKDNYAKYGPAVYGMSNSVITIGDDLKCTGNYVLDSDPQVYSDIYLYNSSISISKDNPLAYDHTILVEKSGVTDSSHQLVGKDFTGETFYNLTPSYGIYHMYLKLNTQTQKFDLYMATYGADQYTYSHNNYDVVATKIADTSVKYSARINHDSLYFYNDGNKCVGFEIVYSGDWKNYGAATPMITYCGRNTTVYEATNIAPTAIGQYTAKVTFPGCDEYYYNFSIVEQVLYVNGVNMIQGGYLANGASSLTQDAPLSGGYVYYNKTTKELELNNAVLNGVSSYQILTSFLEYQSSNLVNVTYKSVIFANGDLTIKLSGENTLNTQSLQCGTNGVYIKMVSSSNIEYFIGFGITSLGDLKVKGASDAKLTLTSDSVSSAFSLLSSMYGNLSIEGGQLTLNTDRNAIGYGIVTQYNNTVSKGEKDLKAEYPCSSDYVNSGNVIFKNSTVKIAGGSYEQNSISALFANKTLKFDVGSNVEIDAISAINIQTHSNSCIHFVNGHSLVKDDYIVSQSMSAENKDKYNYGDFENISYVKVENGKLTAIDFKVFITVFAGDVTTEREIGYYYAAIKRSESYDLTDLINNLRDKGYYVSDIQYKNSSSQFVSHSFDSNIVQPMTSGSYNEFVRYTTYSEFSIILDVYCKPYIEEEPNALNGFTVDVKPYDYEGENKSVSYAWYKADINKDSFDSNSKWFITHIDSLSASQISGNSLIPLCVEGNGEDRGVIYGYFNIYKETVIWLKSSSSDLEGSFFINTTPMKYDSNDGYYKGVIEHANPGILMASSKTYLYYFGEETPTISELCIISYQKTGDMLEEQTTNQIDYNVVEQDTNYVCVTSFNTSGSKDFSLVSHIYFVGHKAHDLFFDSKLTQETIKNYKTTSEGSSTSYDYYLESGNYYLDENVEFVHPIVIGKDEVVNLCLHDKVLIAGLGIYNYGTLNIYDCNDGNNSTSKYFRYVKNEDFYEYKLTSNSTAYSVLGGVITGFNKELYYSAYSSNLVYNYVYDSGLQTGFKSYPMIVNRKTLNLHSGNISGYYGDCAILNLDDLYMYGGNVTLNVNELTIYNICNDNITSHGYFYGGNVKDNIGAGIYSFNAKTSTLTDSSTFGGTFVCKNNVFIESDDTIYMDAAVSAIKVGTDDYVPASGMNVGIFIDTYNNGESILPIAYADRVTISGELEAKYDQYFFGNLNLIIEDYEDGDIHYLYAYSVNETVTPSAEDGYKYIIYTVEQSSEEYKWYRSTNNPCFPELVSEGYELDESEVTVSDKYYCLVKDDNGKYFYSDYVYFRSAVIIANGGEGEYRVSGFLGEKVKMYKDAANTAVTKIGQRFSVAKLDGVDYVWEEEITIGEDDIIYVPVWESVFEVAISSVCSRDATQSGVYRPSGDNQLKADDTVTVTYKVTVNTGMIESLFDLSYPGAFSLVSVTLLETTIFSLTEDTSNGTDKIEISTKDGEISKFTGDLFEVQYKVSSDISTLGKYSFGLNEKGTGTGMFKVTGSYVAYEAGHNDVAVSFENNVKTTDLYVKDTLTLTTTTVEFTYDAENVTITDIGAKITKSDNSEYTYNGYEFYTDKSGAKDEKVTYIKKAGSYHLVVEITESDEYDGLSEDVGITIKKIKLYTVLTVEEDSYDLATLSYKEGDTAAEKILECDKATFDVTFSCESSVGTISTLNTTPKTIMFALAGPGSIKATPNDPNYEIDDYTLEVSKITAVVASALSVSMPEALTNADKTFLTGKGFTSTTLTFTYDSADHGHTSYTKVYYGFNGTDFDVEGLDLEYFDQSGTYQIPYANSKFDVANKISNVAKFGSVIDCGDENYVVISYKVVEYTIKYYYKLKNAEDWIYAEDKDQTVRKKTTISGIGSFSNDTWFINFTGWCTDEACEIPVTEVTSSVSLYALYVFDNSHIGDVNLDGSVTTTDVTIYRKAILGSKDVYCMDTVSQLAQNNTNDALNNDVVKLFNLRNTTLSDSNIKLNFDQTNGKAVYLFINGRANCDFDSDSYYDLSDIIAIRQALVDSFPFDVDDTKDTIYKIPMFELMDTTFALVDGTDTYKTTSVTAFPRYVEYSNGRQYGFISTEYTESTDYTFVVKYNGPIELVEEDSYAFGKNYESHTAEHITCDFKIITESGKTYVVVTSNDPVNAIYVLFNSESFGLSFNQPAV